MPPPRLVVTGGGSGGHIFPALAVAETAARLYPGAALLYMGGHEGMEAQIVPSLGVAYQAVTARKLTRLASLSTVAVAWSLVRGYRQATGYLKAFQPDAVVGTGGYVAGAVAFAAARRGIRTVIVEPNVRAGRTNLAQARFVNRICLSWRQTAAQFPAGKTSVTGLPLRRGITLPPEIDARQARERLGLRAEPFTVVVIGGSQGARAVNGLVAGAAPRLLGCGMQILHQVGARNAEAARQAARERGILDDGAYRMAPFLDSEQMPAAFRAADLIVCRGGMSTLSEVMANGAPAIVVPLPTAYADHQTANARAMEEAGAATHCAEAELTPDSLAERLLKLQADSGLRERLAIASRELGRPDAADAVCQLALERG